MTPGAWIKKRRRALGLTQPEVASAVGITQSHLSRIERGSDTTISTLFAIARVLRCHPAELLGGLPPEATRPGRPIILTREKAHLLEPLRKVFNAHPDVEALVDRREGERRTEQRTVARNRRRRERRAKIAPVI